MARQVDNDDLNASARGQYDLRQTPEREVFLKELNLFTEKSPSVPPLPSEYDTDKYRGISVSEVTALNDSVFDDHINTTYPSRVDAVTTISGFLHGNHQNSSLPIYSNSFQSSDRFSNSQTSTPQFNNFKPQPPVRKSSFMPRREKEPDKFDGRSVEWKDFIVQFEHVSLWNRWSVHEKAQQLVMCLRGSAQKMLGDLTYNELNNYDILKSVLSNRFSPAERVFSYRSEFRNRRRQKQESVSDYGYALRRLSCLAYPEVPHSFREINVIEQFINGLSSHDLKKHVSLNHPKSLDGAIALATEYEAFEGSQITLVKPKETFEYEESGVRSVTAKLSKEKSLENELSKSNSDISKLVETMQGCLKKISDLEGIINSGSQRGSFYSRGRGFGRGRGRGFSRNMDDVDCYVCHAKGHLSYDCPLTQAMLVPLNFLLEDFLAWKCRQFVPYALSLL